MLKEINSFSDLGLNANIVYVLNEIGYVKPLPIQARCIPYLLSGLDVLGMAHTGSGKTAAFVLPLLNNINVKDYYSQGLIIAPTRELIIQIGKVCLGFIKYIKEINIVTLYGGQSYDIELKALKKKAHVIVSTPGRLLDHLRRNTVNLSQVKTLVIDEADEMLRMGFVEDVERIIKYMPTGRQTALFSATLPVGIRNVSNRFMNDPKEVYVHTNTNVCSDIRQNYCLVYGIDKQEVLMRFLEIEDFDAAIVFVRTKCATLEIAELLKNFGYNSAALNGDMSQIIRHRTLEDLRYGRLDILIATDVAARGLDVQRISLVINYDVPINSDAYIHRIGRTGRAGKIGKSLLFVNRKEYRLLTNIKNKINVNIMEVPYPTTKYILSYRLKKFSRKIENYLNTDDLDIYQSLLVQIKTDSELTIDNLAAVLLKMAQGKRPLVLPGMNTVMKKGLNNSDKYSKKNQLSVSNYYSAYCSLYNEELKDMTTASGIKISSKNRELYHIAVGRKDGVKIRHIIGALTNKIDIGSKDIGNIQLFSSYAIVELSKDLLNSKKQRLYRLSRIRIFNKLVNMKLLKNTEFYSSYKEA